MAKNNNLTDFLTSLADKYRAVLGTTEPINPQDFEAKVDEIAYVDEISAKGKTLVLQDSAEKPLNSLKIYGNGGGSGARTKNLIPFPYADTSKTVNGVVWTVNDDGSITANGTATVSSSFNFANNGDTWGLKSGDTITISLGEGVTWAIGGFICIYNRTDGSSFPLFNFMGTNGGYTEPMTVTVPDDFVSIQFCRILVNPSQTVNNVTVYPQIELGSVATEYEPVSTAPLENPVITLTDESGTQEQSVTISGIYGNGYNIVVENGKVFFEQPNEQPMDITNRPFAQSLLGLHTYYPQTIVECDGVCEVGYKVDAVYGYNRLKAEYEAVATDLEDAVSALNVLGVSE